MLTSAIAGAARTSATRAIRHFLMLISSNLHAYSAENGATAMCELIHHDSLPRTLRQRLDLNVLVAHRAVGVVTLQRDGALAETAAIEILGSAPIRRLGPL